MLARTALALRVVVTFLRIASRLAVDLYDLVCSGLLKVGDALVEFRERRRVSGLGNGTSGVGVFEALHRGLSVVRGREEEEEDGDESGEGGDRGGGPLHVVGVMQVQMMVKIGRNRSTLRICIGID